MPNMSMNKTPVKEQDPNVRNKNFLEVNLGYTDEEAREEAARCLNCKNPLCMEGCPVSVPIPAFIQKVLEGDNAGAYATISTANALPAVCGRVCPQESQCEGRCIRGKKGEPVGIGRLERYVADWAIKNGTKGAELAPANGKRVAVIGSGPSGLTCAGELAKKGYDVTIFEAFHVAGGVLSYGIPEFRLPKSIVEKEVSNLEKMGVKIELNVVVGKTVTIDELLEEEGFDAVFIGSGAGLPQFLKIPGEGLVAARSSKRMGADVHIVYRRGEEELPARKEEVHHAKEEGIVFDLLCNPVRINGDEKGRVKSVTCIRMELGEPDEKGRRRPVPIEGSEFDIEADTVIVSIGTSPNPLIRTTTEGLEANKHGCITTAEDGSTSREGIFCGGDAATGAATVILAMGAGKCAAKSIDEYLSNK